MGSQFLVLVINYGVTFPVLFCCILVNMVRKYKRRTERGKFTAADLQDAARKVNEDKRSIRSVAKEAGICYVTQNRYIKKHRDGIPSSIPSYNTESKQVFSEVTREWTQIVHQKGSRYILWTITKGCSSLSISVCEEVQCKNAIDVGRKGVCRIRFVKRISKETPVIINSCSWANQLGKVNKFQQRKCWEFFRQTGRSNGSLCLIIFGMLIRRESQQYRNQIKL